jgi:MFS family permease
VLALVGAGSVLAGFTGGRLISRIGRRSTLIAVGILPVLTCAATGLFPNAWVAVPMYTVQAMASTLFTIVTLSLRQQLIPDHLLGRVNSVYRWFAAGGMALGALAGAFIAEAWAYVLLWPRPSCRRGHRWPRSRPLIDAVRGRCHDATSAG